MPLRAAAKGRVEFWPTIKPSNEPEPDYWQPVDVQSETSPVVQLALQVARQIEQWVGKVKLPGHEEAIKAGDIMILLPRREPFGSEIIRQLKERRVPVAGADRIRLTEQIAIMDLIALGRFVLVARRRLQSGRPAALAALRASARKNCSRLSHDRSGTLVAGPAPATCRDACARRRIEFLSEMLERADFAPPFEFYSHALIASRHAAEVAAAARARSGRCDRRIPLALLRL